MNSIAGRCVIVGVLLGAVGLILAAGFNNSAVASEAGRILFLPAGCNPILTPGFPETWDAGVVSLPKVLPHKGALYVFYTGTPGTLPEMGPPAIGVAATTDGVTFRKFDRNPLLEGDGDGFDAYAVSEGVPFVDGDGLVLLYNARATEGHGPGRSIGRATATEVTGPWTRDDQPALTVGPEGAWDSGFVSPNCVVSTEGGYILYYSGGETFEDGEPRRLGVATSPDGITWTKYDDPKTTNPPFAQRDPILELGQNGAWDSFAAWEASVLKTQTGWEMFYEGIGPVDTPIGRAVQIGFAKSVDGIRWTKYENNPILGLGSEPLAESFGVEVPSVVATKCYYYLYYDYGLHVRVIGVALGRLTPATSDE